jgi:hypothetical protein
LIVDGGNHGVGPHFLDIRLTELLLVCSRKL